MDKQKKNILLIICDQLSAQALPAWGNSFAKTPNINSIVESGVRFNNTFTTCPLCQPARASFWTGLYPHQTGVMSNGRQHYVPNLSETIPTLGETFAAGGYKTVHFGKQHDAGSLRGFDLAPITEREIKNVSAVFPINYDSREDLNTSEQTIKFLNNYSDKVPYFTVADMNNPHDICNWIGKFQHNNKLVKTDCELPPLPKNLYRDDKDFKKLPLPIQYICCTHNRQAQIAEWSEEKIRYYLLAYHHYLTRVDDEIGKILTAVRQRHDKNNTLIVLMADHGDSMCGRWMATKHTSFYDETVKVPLVFSGMGINGKNRSVKKLVSLLDLFPTLCDYADIKLNFLTEGKSLLPWLTDHPTGSLHEFVAAQWHTEWGFTIEPGRMIRTEKYKYTHYLEKNGEELYDLVADPGELKNLVGNSDYESILKEHRKILTNYVSATNDPYFNLEWKVDRQWRKHKSGYRSHRGIAAPQQ